MIKFSYLFVITSRTRKAYHVEESKYLEGHIYHMVHFRNLKSIFSIYAILSKNLLQKEGLVHLSIAYQTVQDLRDRIFIWDFLEKTYYSLHRYVPFYFSVKSSPMLYIQHSRGIQNQLIILEISRTILREQGVLFTNGNASNQRLSKYKGEKVGIVPATAATNYLCRRIYRPGGPYGTGSHISEIYADVNLLDRLDWAGISGSPAIEDRDESEWIRSPESKWVRSAEVLVPDSVPLSKISNIAVSTPSMVDKVNSLIVHLGLQGTLPSAIHRPDLFL